MTPRWALISFPIFGLAWLILGTLRLTEGDTGTGVVQLAIGIGWLLLAAFKGKRPVAPTDDKSRPDEAT